MRNLSYVVYQFVRLREICWKDSNTAELTSFQKLEIAINTQVFQNKTHL